MPGTGAVLNYVSFPQLPHSHPSLWGLDSSGWKPPTASWKLAPSPATWTSKLGLLRCGGTVKIGVPRCRSNLGPSEAPSRPLPPQSWGYPQLSMGHRPVLALAPRPQVTGWGGRGLSSQTADVLMTFPSPPSLGDDNNNPPRALHTSYNQLIHIRSQDGHHHPRGQLLKG